MNTTDHGLRVGRHYRFDLAGGAALWTLDGTVQAIYASHGEWKIVVENYRATVTVHKDDRDRTMIVAGDAMTIPVESILLVEEINPHA